MLQRDGAARRSGRWVRRPPCGRPDTAKMGAPFGRLIATQALALIIDLSELRSNAAHRGFMTAFAKAICEEFYFLYEKYSSNHHGFEVT